MAILVAALAAAAISHARDPRPPQTPLLMDAVRLRNGAVLKGAILEDHPGGMRFLNVRQSPGRPTVQFTLTFTPEEIEGVERIAAGDRERLRQWLKDLEQLPQIEKQTLEAMRLEPMDWQGKAGAGRRYRSELFVLESDATEDIVRRAAVRLEQIYAAYMRFLPPRSNRAQPTTIALFQSREGYEESLRQRNQQHGHVAFYDPEANRITAYSDLARLGEDLDRVRQQHQLLRADLDRQEAALTKLYRGPELARRLQTLRATRQKIDAAERQNDGVFDHATRRHFGLLYHEAFHAYLANFVATPALTVPRWLNEGLAQLFENAFVEAGEMRVGHADRHRLARVKEAVRRGELLPVGRLIRSSSRDYLLVHRSDQSSTDAHYLAAWALAFHLTFDRHLIGGKGFETFCDALTRGGDPEEAFSAWVGRSITAFEADFHRYLLRLQPDGSTPAVLPEK